MHIINARNVAEALPLGMAYLREYGRRETSRAGDVLVAPGPVCTVYSHPTERVLFSAARDANPFFHLAEALWMLAGRNDAAFLNQFVTTFGPRFAEPDGTLHGAYGYRWRKTFGFDQLHKVVWKLKENPRDRQAVIQMWDGRETADAYDSGTVYVDTDDLLGEWKDRPCNTHIYLRVRDQVLDITVCCRSNDMLWGAYGANAVHFSVLQEYLAARIGVGVGTYYQFSNNFHGYVAELDKHEADMTDLRPSLRPMPLVDDPVMFDSELNTLLAGKSLGGVLNRFFVHTAYTMMQAHATWRAKGDPTRWLDAIGADDWRAAATEWIARRRKA